MKNKTIFFILATAVLSVPVFTQVTITAKKTTYTRPKPLADYKKKFTITYPKVRASTPALSKKIESTISYERSFDFKLKDELTDYQWLEDASYDVIYNKGKILCLSLMMEGSAAYPSSSTRYLVVDTSTGNQARPADVFTNNSKLLAKLVKMKDEEVAKTIADLKADPTMDEDVSLFFNDAETYHKVKLDEFTVTSKGVTFHHDYGFPHVAQALQPTGEFFLSWKNIKPYIKSGGLLAALAR